MTLTKGKIMEICHVCDEEYEPSEPEEVEEFPEKSVPRTFEAKWLHNHLLEWGYKLRVWQCPHCGGTAKATTEVDFKDLLGLSEGCPEMAEEKEHKARDRAWRIEHGVHADPSGLRASRTGDTVIASKHLWQRQLESTRCSGRTLSPNFGGMCTTRSYTSRKT